MPTTSTKIYSKNWEKNDMKLTKDQAKFLIKSYRGKTKNDTWIDHCICVGDTAGRIAKALNKKGQNVDIDKTITLGYLHDIGKFDNEAQNHEVRGYEFLKNRGYDEEYCNICLTHSFLNNDIICTAGGVPNPESDLFFT